VIEKAHGWFIYSIAISNDDKTFITGSADYSLKLWDLESR
jgi:WD40 repeat protein